MVHRPAGKTLICPGYVSRTTNGLLRWHVSFKCSVRAQDPIYGFILHFFSHFSCTFQVEKYRPQLVKDIVGNAEAVGRLQVIAEEGNLPNVILSVSLDRPCWFHKAFKTKKTTEKDLG